MGFLPYWLIGKASTNYSEYLDGIYYFGLTIGDNGNIVKLANPQEEEPGWYDLESGKADRYLQSAKNNHQTLSLTAFSGVKRLNRCFGKRPRQTRRQSYFRHSSGYEKVWIHGFKIWMLNILTSHPKARELILHNSSKK